ncbi:hypothetical protein E2C01_024479 [Portunus trituberculatus]|uniref:Uncharacterized protein n=1 Tax=Portunus trituberculatus TaxID=210409 RepID=A0A5B7ECY3_PORTR|nr:hypothetical protein [Portunus trituberculatus]
MKRVSLEHSLHHISDLERNKRGGRQWIVVLHRHVVEEAALFHQREGELQGVHDPPQGLVSHLEPLAHEHMPHNV